MFIREEFERSKRENAAKQAKDVVLQKLSLDFTLAADKAGFAYQWTWLGLPIIQMPTDIVAMQEIIWAKKPDLIIETGIAWGGSVLLHASIMHIIGNGRVVAVDLNLYDHVREQIMSCSVSERISLLKGSSTSPDIIRTIKSEVQSGQSVMVVLDSNHSHEHVLNELRTYGPLVTNGQFLVVSDTIVEDMPPPHPDRPRPWGPGNSPSSAVNQFLRENNTFEVDTHVNDKLLNSFTPSGYLRRVR